MRVIINQQLPLMQGFVAHEHGHELATMSAILDQVPGVLQAIERDLLRGRKAEVGRPGLSAEQVLRVLVLKQLNGFAYEALAFHLVDSRSYRAFCRLGECEEAPSRSTLQANIKRLSAETLEGVNRALVRGAQSRGVERGEKLRVDCTTTEATMHWPSDSALLWDVTRVLGRSMTRATRRFGQTFVDRRRSAKRRWREIQHAKRRPDQVRSYRKLLEATETMLDQAETMVKNLAKWRGPEPETRDARKLSAALKHYVKLGRAVVSQTRRRVIEGEAVPSSDKVVSIFEDHADILVKGPNDPEYGHKVCLTTGRSGLVVDAEVLAGNPADQTLAVTMIERAEEIFGRPPRQVAFDGGFASKENLKGIKALGVGDVAFSKRGGLAISDMVKSTWVYKQLRSFRAGIEAGISFLKRCFGVGRCTWKSLRSFHAYVWSSIVSANLLILARHTLARDPAS
jgi:IS5 family transposase